MGNVHKNAMISFGLPVISCGISWFMPDVNPLFSFISVMVLILLIVSYLVMLVVFKKKKRVNAGRLFAFFNMIAFCLFFTFPLMKIYSGHLWIQLLLAAFFLLCIFLAIYDQNQETPLVFPGDDKEPRKFAYVFYAIPVVLTLLGGGGNIIVVREMHLTFGDDIMRPWGSFIMYSLGCWLAFLFNSLRYQAHVKEGLLVR